MSYREERREECREERREEFREECREERREERCEKNEYCIDGILYKVKLKEVRRDECELIVTPCNTPTSIFCICCIKKKENCCNDMTYYESVINCHDVRIIQECSLEKIIKESIHIYFENSRFSYHECENERNGCRRANGRYGFNVFGL